MDAHLFQLIEFRADILVGLARQAERSQVDDGDVAYFEPAESLRPVGVQDFRRGLVKGQAPAVETAVLRKSLNQRWELFRRPGGISQDKGKVVAHTKRDERAARVRKEKRLVGPELEKVLSRPAISGQDLRGSSPVTGLC